MQEFKVKNGKLFYASQPEKANDDFIAEAKNRNINLCKTTIADVTQYKYSAVTYFGDKNLYPICKEKEYLILPKDTKSFFVLQEQIFNELFENTKGDLEMKNDDLNLSSNVLSGKSFFLDAGHGGKDSGAINDDLGLQEKIAALLVVLKLGNELEKSGAIVYYSRQDDTYPSLSKRAEEANRLKATAFISIHLNSADNKTASGIETLVYNKNGFAYKLAENVQEQLILWTHAKDRGVKERPELTVLKKTAMPAILCEIGFISNNDEARKLFSGYYQDRIVKAIYSGIIATYK